MVAGWQGEGLRLGLILPCAGANKPELVISCFFHPVLSLKFLAEARRLFVDVWTAHSV